MKGGFPPGVCISSCLRPATQAWGLQEDRAQTGLTLQACVVLSSASVLAGGPLWTVEQGTWSSGAGASLVMTRTWRPGGTLEAFGGVFPHPRLSDLSRQGLTCLQVGLDYP